MEDISRLDVTLMPHYCAFWVRGCALKLKKLSLVSADRTSTNNYNQAVEAIHGDAAQRTGQNIIVDKCNI